MKSDRRSEETVLAAVVADVYRAAVALGFDPIALRNATGIDPAALADPDARVPVAWDRTLWLHVSQRAVGLALGDRLGLSTIGVLGYAMQHLGTVGEALAWLQRFRAVLHPELVPRIERRQSPEGDLLVFANPITGPLAALREPVYAYASATRRLIVELTGRDVVIRSVTYPLSRSRDAVAHERWFRAPVHWNGAQFELAVDADVDAAPLPRRDPRLFDYLARRVAALDEARLDETTTQQRVRREIARLLPQGEPRQSDVAQRLAMSVRTLQRQLAAESTTFAELVDAVRQARCEVLLQDASLTAGQVGFLLGYSEPSAFFRAFRRWEGVSPQQWRATRAPAPMSTTKASDVEPRSHSPS